MVAAPAPADGAPAFTASDTYETGTEATLWQDAWRRLRRNRLAMAGGVVILLLVVVAAIAQFWTPTPFIRNT